MRPTAGVEHSTVRHSRDERSTARQTPERILHWWSDGVEPFSRGCFLHRYRRLFFARAWAETPGGGHGERDLPRVVRRLLQLLQVADRTEAFRCSRHWGCGGSNEKMRQHERREAISAE